MKGETFRGSQNDGNERSDDGDDEKRVESVQVRRDVYLQRRLRNGFAEHFDHPKTLGKSFGSFCIGGVRAYRWFVFPEMFDGDKEKGDWEEIEEGEDEVEEDSRTSAFSNKHANSDDQLNDPR